MKNFSCPDLAKLGQNGIAIPLIVVIIAIASFGLGIVGPAIYPQVKLQIEKLVVNPAPGPDTKESTESSSQTSDQQAPEESLDSQNEEEKSTAPSKKSTITEKESKDSEDEEGKAEGTGQKDEKEKNQKEEGVENQPPVNLNFKVLDFAKLAGLVKLLPTPTPTPFILKYIGKIKIPSFFSGSTPSPTPTPQPTPVPSNKAIVITLDTVEIHDDEDPALNGEVQIVASVRTGFKEQLIAWPIKNWDEANDGDVLDIHKPIFVLPKSEIDEKIAMWITVSENDSLPSSATGLIEKAYDISAGSSLIYDNPLSALKDELYAQTIGRFLNWLGSEEHIGTYATILVKPFNYGLNNETKKTITQRKGDATFTYTIREVTIPDKPLRVDVKLKKIKVGENGDYDYAGGDGDLYVWTAVSDGFKDKEMNALTRRIPSSGLHDVSDNESWNVDEELLSATISGPILYYEIGVWDEDDVGNDDQLEIVSDTLFMSDYKAGDVLKISDDGDDGVDADATIEREIRFYAVN